MIPPGQEQVAFPDGQVPPVAIVSRDGHVQLFCMNRPVSEH